MTRYSAAKIIVRYHIVEPNEVTSDLAAFAYFNDIFSLGSRPSPTTTSPVATPTRVCRDTGALSATNCLDQLQPSAYSPLGIALMGLRIVEIDEDAVAQVYRLRRGHHRNRRLQSGSMRMPNLRYLVTQARVQLASS